ncbi:hypothetical protein DFS34DRAFT_121416 [Phlyctochytrium arcticum]|nr:hypothetical protein DFS34DRAFT_121416 [Phlyctochytrium arcticum]
MPFYSKFMALRLRSPDDLPGYQSHLSGLTTALPHLDSHDLDTIQRWLSRRIAELEEMLGVYGSDDTVVDLLDRTGHLFERCMALPGSPSNQSKECREDNERVDDEDNKENVAPFPRPTTETWHFPHTNTSLKIHEPTSNDTSTHLQIGAQVWSAGVILARLIDSGYLFPACPESTPLNIVELGSGTGLTSVLAAKVLPTRFSNVHITATDFHVSLLQTGWANASHNEVNPRHLSFRLLDWSKTLIQLSGPLFDHSTNQDLNNINWVLAADVIYDNHHAQDVPHAIHHLLTCQPSSSIPAIKHCAIVARVRPQFLAHITLFEETMQSLSFVGGWKWAEEVLVHVGDGSRRSAGVERQKYRVYEYTLAI